MTTGIKPSERLISLFTEQPCWMIEPLSARVQYSIPSVRRFLVEIGYYSSFTHNGGWYTLGSIPQFDQDGLWYYQDIGFSRAGSLTRTLIDPATRSSAGMTAEKLGEKLHCRCHTVLVQLCRRGKLQRQKVGHSYVYLAVDPPTAVIQRQTMTLQGIPTGQLPAEIAILVLAEFIRKPESTFEQLAGAVAKNTGIIVKVVLIEKLFEQHGLKKTV